MRKVLKKLSVHSKLLRRLRNGVKFFSLKRVKDATVLFHGKINAVLLNGSFFASSSINGTFRKIVTPKERWSYTIEIFFFGIPKEAKVLRLIFRISQGEIGILLEDRKGKIIEEQMVSQSATVVTRVIDCTRSDFDRLYIRNTSAYGCTHIDFLFAELSTDVCSDNDEFPGFEKFEISKNDLRLWSDFYGTRTSTETQLMRAKWLEKQSSQIQITWQNDIRICLDVKSNMTRALVVSGYYEPFELTTFRFLASMSKTIIDVGANIGVYSLIAAISSPSSRTYAIEPSTREYNMLKINRSLNALSNLETFNLAAGEIDGSLTLNIAPQEIAGHNQIAISHQAMLENKWDSEQVNCCQLDTLSSKMGLQIDLIKIDVEGYELSVLNGSQCILKSDKPYILVELTGGLWTNTIHAIRVIESLQNHGYKIFDLDRKLGMWRKFSGWRSETNGNLLCIHDSRLHILADVNQCLTREFNADPSAKHYLQSMDVPILDPIHVFCHSNALSINEARLVHLDSLGLDLTGKKVLEVGGGIGLHTPYFLSLGCNVIFTDVRNENLSIAKQRLKDFAQVELLNLDECSIPLYPLESIDVIYCYGVLYHLMHPERAISALASTNAKLIILETCVNGAKNSVDVDFESENTNNPNQAFSGLGARPTRNWVTNELKKYWKYVYFTVTQPNYPDFPENWNTSSASNTRAIFIGSNTEYLNRSLIAYMPDKQQELEIDYRMASFDRLDQVYSWLQKLPVGTHFMISIAENIPKEIGPILTTLSKHAIITTFSPCLDNTTLLCGKSKSPKN